jgi:hypothetical protein
MAWLGSPWPGLARPCHGLAKLGREWPGPALAGPGLSQPGLAGRAWPRLVKLGLACPRLATPSVDGDGSLVIFVGSVRGAGQGASQTPCADSRALRRLGREWPGPALAGPGLSGGQRVESAASGWVPILVTVVACGSCDARLQ